MAALLLFASFAFPTIHEERWDRRRRLEFSPGLVAHREGIEEDEGWFRTRQRWRIFRTDFQSWLIEQDLVQASSTPEESSDWLLIKSMGEGGHNGFLKGPGRELCRSLGCQTALSSAWVRWSREHPREAKALWPAYFRALRSGRLDEARALIFAVEGPRIFGPASPMPRCSRNPKTILAEYDSRDGPGSK